LGLHCFFCLPSVVLLDTHLITFSSLLFDCGVLPLQL
jgi:hypothetical protein